MCPRRLIRLTHLAGALALVLVLGGAKGCPPPGDPVRREGPAAPAPADPSRNRIIELHASTTGAYMFIDAVATSPDGHRETFPKNPALRRQPGPLVRRRGMDLRHPGRCDPTEALRTVQGQRHQPELLHLLHQVLLAPA